MTTRYKVSLLPVGTAMVPGPELFWMDRFDEWFQLTFQVVLIEGDHLTALINTGPAKDLGPINERWEGVLGPRAAMTRQDGWLITDHLADRGLSVEDITDVILTPLQLYSVGNVDRFRQARIHISRRGWLHYHSTHRHPHDDRWTSIPPHILTYLVVDAWDQVNLLDDEHTIAPGLRTWFAGTHHRATVAVEIDTGLGVVIASDAFFWLENVEKDHPIGITENIYEAMSTYQRVRDRADVILPLYDPANLDRFPGGEVAI